MALWRTVRVFLSSTFRDMHAERDHLVKVSFPRLRERLLPHRVELVDVDLRWGVTAEQAEREQVLALCLEQIEECRPFFLGFLGHRYGWVPSRHPEEARAAFPWIADYPDASVTELEIRHAVLNGPSRPMHALFCLRDRPALESIPEATRLAQFAERDPAVGQRLDRLKEALDTSGYPTYEYTCRWDGDAWDRPTRSLGRLLDLTGFGEVVEEWLLDAIRQELRLPDTPPAVDPLDEEADFHERFLEGRLRIYVGRDDLNETLCAFAGGDEEVPCLLVGPSGMGKSAALAHFVHTLRQRQPGAIILPHFVGGSPHTTSLHGLLGRLCQELKRHLGFAVAVPDDLAGRTTTFLGLLASVPEGRRVVLVLDGLNQLDGGSGSLHWLPERLSPHVKVIASSATGPGRSPEVVEAFAQRSCRTIEIKPLTDADRRTLLRRVPRLSAKTLDDEQVGRLLANPATVNPLFLRTALEELRVYGSFESLDARMDALPREGDSVTALFEHVFQRLEDEFECDLVERVLSLLACARRGLTEPELVALTNGCRGAEELFPVLRQLRPYLLSRVGRLDFYHAGVRRAVIRYYLKRDPDAAVLQPTAKERRTRQQLIAHFLPSRMEPRGVEELPWQMAELRAWQALYELLAEPAFIVVALGTNEFEVCEFWSRVEAESPLRMAEAYRRVVENPATHEPIRVWSIAELFNRTGHPNEARSLRAYQVEHYRGRDEGRHAASLGNLALILRGQGDPEGAMRLLKQQEEICGRLGDPAGLQASLGNQALILKDQGDPEGAMRLHKQEEEICRRLGDPAGLQASLGNQAVILIDQGDPEGAMRLLKQQEEICRRLGHPAGLQASLGNQALILSQQGDPEEAMRLHKQEEEICRRLGDPAELATSLVNQASLLATSFGQPQQALPLVEEAHRLATRHGLVSMAGQIQPLLDQIRRQAGALGDRPPSGLGWIRPLLRGWRWLSGLRGGSKPRAFGPGFTPTG